jgi:signal peptidase II
MSFRIIAPALFRNAVILAGFVIVADQFSKWLVMVEIMQPPRVIPVLPLLNIVMAWNTGVSFSMLRDTGPQLLSAVAILVSAGLTLWLAQISQPVPAYGVGLVVGGAIGNVVDRFRFGAVFDFIDFYVGDWHWPAFNLADSAITTGVILLLFDGLFQGRDRGKNTS